MDEPQKKTLMRSLGEFVGHVVKAVRTDPPHPAQPESRKRETVRTTVEEEDRGSMILRRTTIEEVEINPTQSDQSPSGDPPRPMDH